MTDLQISRRELIKTVVVRFGSAFIVLMAMFFIPAGTWAYWEAWAYLAILFFPMLFVLAYMLKHEPDLLARRMRMKEKEAEQRLIVKLSFIPFLFAYILPGFDKRFGWSNVPTGVVVIAEILVLLGYGIVFLVFRENRFASRVVEVEQGQSVIKSGPYAIVRHPMYTGSILLWGLSPLALGSYWAMLPALAIIPTLVARIRNEEQILAKELKGYPEYMQETRYRLLPGVW
jgi:protein-S-isoprenylcysteine O-methyltransferase Ste14